MQEIIERFSEIISSYCILQDEEVEGGHKFKVIIRFIDSSRLEGRDFTFPKKRYYSFHWMKEDNSLIIRWDNTEHHPTIKTFPFHIHIGKKENIQESPEVTLYEVLEYVKEIIFP
ncbi:MAG: hypothetical protein KBF93_04145 [Leptospiraceae bacterium]|nr:hypothetical protein [Leptospiraceae bacterium]